MLTALFSPIHRENGVSSQISRVHGISARGFALYETKTITFTQGLKQKAWVSPVLLANCGSSIFGYKIVVQRGVPFLRPGKAIFE